MDAGRREGRALNGHPGILLFSIWVHCLPPPSALPPLSLLCSCQMLVSLVIKTLGADRGCQAPGICEGWKRRRNKFVFVEWKFVCVRMSPSPASLVAPHLGWTGPGHEQGWKLGLTRPQETQCWGGLLPSEVCPIPLTPSQDHSPLSHPCPCWDEALLPAPTTDQKASVNKGFPCNTHLPHLARRIRSVGSQDQGGTLSPSVQLWTGPIVSSSQYISNPKVSSKTCTE